MSALVYFHPKLSVDLARTICARAGYVLRHRGSRVVGQQPQRFSCRYCDWAGAEPDWVAPGDHQHALGEIPRCPTCRSYRLTFHNNL